MTELKTDETPEDALKIKGKRKSCAGIVMVEALISLVLFAIFITGGCKLLLAHRQITDMARAHYAAANIAKNHLELIRSFDYSQRGNFSETDVLVNEIGIPDSNGRYRRNTEYTSVSSNIVEIMVTVDIMDRKQLAFTGRSESLKSYYANQ